jgi:hypothetical protein
MQPPPTATSRERSLKQHLRCTDMWPGRRCDESEERQREFNYTAPASAWSPLDAMPLLQTRHSKGGQQDMKKLWAQLGRANSCPIEHQASPSPLLLCINTEQGDACFIPFLFIQKHFWAALTATRWARVQRFHISSTLRCPPPPLSSTPSTLLLQAGCCQRSKCPTINDAQEQASWLAGCSSHPPPSLGAQIHGPAASSARYALGVLEACRPKGDQVSPVHHSLHGYGHDGSTTSSNDVRTQVLPESSRFRPARVASPWYVRVVGCFFRVAILPKLLLAIHQARSE